MIIYKTTNLINSKIYIGQDSKNDSNYLGSGKILNYAIKKYGRENFKKEILEECKTKEELNKQEIYWIKFYNSINKSIGYNINEGGSGGDNYTNNPNMEEIRKKISIGVRNSGRVPHRYTDEDKKRMSLNTKKQLAKETEIEKRERLQKGKETKLLKGTHPSQEYMRKLNSLKQKGRKHSEETKEKLRNRILPPVSDETKRKISKSRKGSVMPQDVKLKISKTLKGRPSPNKGKVLSEEQKIKISSSLKSRVLSKEFLDNLKERNKNRTGYNHTQEAKKQISLKNKGRIQTTEEKEKRRISMLNVKRDRYFQINLENRNIINIFNSLKEVVDYLGLGTSSFSIGRVCRGEQKSYKGFDWVRENTNKYKMYEINK